MIGVLGRAFLYYSPTLIGTCTSRRTADAGGGVREEYNVSCAVSGENVANLRGAWLEFFLC